MGMVWHTAYGTAGHPQEMATAAARQNREDAARLLEENAQLKSRLAAKAFAEVSSGECIAMRLRK